MSKQLYHWEFLLRSNQTYVTSIWTDNEAEAWGIVVRMEKTLNPCEFNQATRGGYCKAIMKRPVNTDVQLNHDREVAIKKKLESIISQSTSCTQAMSIAQKAGIDPNRAAEAWAFRGH